jgi:hypothetical protein
MATAENRGVRMSVELAGQYTNLGPTGWAKLERLSLSDLGASQFIDSVQYYDFERSTYAAQGRQDVARAYADSILRIGMSPRWTGPIVSWKYSILATAYAGLGKRAEAMQQIALSERYLETLAPDEPGRGQIENQIVHVFGTLGEVDSTIAHARTLLKLPSGFSLATARTDIAFVPLRGKPAWERFLAGQ